MRILVLMKVMFVTSHHPRYITCVTHYLFTCDAILVARGFYSPLNPCAYKKKNSKGLISALERYDSPLYEIAIIPKIPDINVCQIGG